jgi:hypothetical protein
MTDATIKTDRFSNRAPKGGAVSLVNGQFYLGGQFMPMVAKVESTTDTMPAKPATLEGSTRQVAWANRLRAALANLNDEISARLLFLNSPKTASEVRPAIKQLLITRHGLMTERSALRVIERRAELI